MPFDLKEKERIRYHLGYMNSAENAASIQLGIPRPAQTLFLLESAMNLLIVQAEERARRILNTLDRIECLMAGDAIDNLEMESVEGIKMRPDHLDKLEMEYKRWAQRLADLFGVPLYPYSARNAGGVVAGNIKVGR